MNRLTIDEVRAVQASLRETVREYTLGPELGDLDVLVRLAMEFRHFLIELASGKVEPAEVRYKCESVFSGIDSFREICSYYRMMSDDAFNPEWEAKTFAALRDEFASKYQRFLDETSFPVRCRLLLDLFELQLVFTGMAYD